jgi:hypothetical protein
MMQGQLAQSCMTSGMKKIWVISLLDYNYLVAAAVYCSYTLQYSLLYFCSQNSSNWLQEGAFP